MSRTAAAAAGDEEAATTSLPEALVANARRCEGVAVDGGHEEREANDEDEDEQEVTTDVFDLPLSGTAPWATAFLESASEGDLEAVVELLDTAHVAVDAVDVDGFTALMIAAAEGQRTVALELLRRGADVGMRTHELRSTALHFAAKSGIADVVEAICVQDSSCVDRANVDGDTPLVWACTEGRSAAVQILLQHGADVNVLSHRAMSTLICAVIMRDEEEDDDSIHQGSEGLDAAAHADAERATIVAALLTANPKLVNYQDRDGSTAMHLAMSHGYLACVKALVKFGADITLRNGIGQTPLEEAEESGFQESEACVAYLRGIWARLEEEASARMMAMLEMEEMAGPEGGATVTSRTSKKNKKRQKKGKRKGGKAVVTTAVSVTTDKKATPDDDASPAATDGNAGNDESHSSGESSDEDSGNPSPGSAVVAVASPDIQTSDAHEDAGVWTTVRRKSKVIDPPIPVYEKQPVQEESKSSSGVSPTLARGNKAISSAKSSSNYRKRPSAGSAVATPGTNALNPTVASSSVDTTNVTARITTPSSQSSVSVASVKSPFSTFQSAPHSSPISRLYHRQPLPTGPSASASQFSSVVDAADGSYWGKRSVVSAAHSGAAALTVSSIGSRFAPPQNTHPANGPSAIWKYTSILSSSNPGLYGNHQSVVPLGSRGSNQHHEWMGERIRDSADSVEDALRFLACGICGELVDDNLQCDGNLGNAPCPQLYCASCLVRARGANTMPMQQLVVKATLKCIKCRHDMDCGSLQNNALAQAQAAALGLASHSRHRTRKNAESEFTLEAMEACMAHAVERVAAVDLHPFYLAPGANLSTLSTGQLDVLEEMHLSALQQITEARLEHARVQERLRIEEWLKAQRDLYQVSMAAAASRTASTSPPHPDSLQR